MGQGFGSVWNDWGDRRGGVGCGCEAVTDFGGERFGCMGGMGRDAGAAWRMSAFHVRRGDMAPGEKRNITVSRIIRTGI